MSFTASHVRELRTRSGAGIVDCKNALTECGGDMEAAIVYLQKKGLADAQKRSGRSTQNGRIYIAHNEKHAVILELLCETDFVARNDAFIALGRDVTSVMIGSADESEKKTQIEERIKNSIGVIKENIQMGRHTLIPLDQNSAVNNYVHGEDGAIGAVVVAAVSDARTIDNKALGVFLHDIAMHICACRPQYLDETQVPTAYRQKQMDIFMEQAKNSGKPEHVQEKIAQGKLHKHFGEICLLKQKFVKEEKKTVQAVLSEVSQQLQQEIHITHFAYYKAGEQE